MKYQKYLLLLITMLIGCNKIYALNKTVYLTQNNYFNNTDSVLIMPLTTENTADCESLFGSIKPILNDILKYPKIIVPILVIALGMLDFAKAVIAGKEDEMKKAQKTFIKRIIIGVAFFFIPVFINIVMDLADIVWEGLGYSTCEL